VRPDPSSSSAVLESWSTRRSGLACAKHPLDLAGSLCSAEQETLHFFALKLSKHISLRFGLNTFGMRIDGLRQRSFDLPSPRPLCQLL
jgi:hypothetical protein